MSRDLHLSTISEVTAVMGLEKKRNFILDHFNYFLVWLLSAN